MAGKKLDYLVINHMEPDHGASIEEILLQYPDVKIVSTEKAFMLMHQFVFQVAGHGQIKAMESNTPAFGNHTVTFYVTNGVLFVADTFGAFGALDGKIFKDEVNFDRDWINNERRYLTNIAGKYDPHVQALASALHADKAVELEWLADEIAESIDMGEK